MTFSRRSKCPPLLAEIARRPLQDPPGQVGAGFQVAGALVEAVTGERWADVFNERLGRPFEIPDNVGTTW